jgi:hypothetical protein
MSKSTQEIPILSAQKALPDDISGLVSKYLEREARYGELPPEVRNLALAVQRADNIDLVQVTETAPANLLRLLGKIEKADAVSTFLVEKETQEIETFDIKEYLESSSENQAKTTKKHLGKIVMVVKVQK